MGLGRIIVPRRANCNGHTNRVEARVARQLCRVLQSQSEILEGENMAISQDLLEMLVCPLCKVPVKLLDDQSGLKCPSCCRVYPVRDDIPVMLLEEASIANE